VQGTQLAQAAGTGTVRCPGQGAPAPNPAGVHGAQTARPRGGSTSWADAKLVLDEPVQSVTDEQQCPAPRQPGALQPTMFDGACEVHALSEGKSSQTQPDSSPVMAAAGPVAEAIADANLCARAGKQQHRQIQEPAPCNSSQRLQPAPGVPAKPQDPSAAAAACYPRTRTEAAPPTAQPAAPAVAHVFTSRPGSPQTAPDPSLSADRPSSLAGQSESPDRDGAFPALQYRCMMCCSCVCSAAAAHSVFAWLLALHCMRIAVPHRAQRFGQFQWTLCSGQRRTEPRVITCRRHSCAHPL
jgi:hypothetical protein